MQIELTHDEIKMAIRREISNRLGVGIDQMPPEEIFFNCDSTDDMLITAHGVSVHKMRATIVTRKRRPIKLLRDLEDDATH